MERRQHHEIARRAACVLLGVALGVMADRLASQGGGRRSDAGSDSPATARSGSHAAATMPGDEDAARAACEGGALQVNCLFAFLDLIEDADEQIDEARPCDQRFAQLNLLEPLVHERYDVAEKIARRLDSDSRSVALAAAWLLGEYRLEPAIPRLLDHLNLEEHRHCLNTKFPLWREFPAAEALVVIGTPSIQPTIERLGYETDELRRNLEVWVIQRVEGTERGVQDLDLARRDAKTASAREKYAEAMVRLPQGRWHVP